MIQKCKDGVPRMSSATAEVICKLEVLLLYVKIWIIHRFAWEVITLTSLQYSKTIISKPWENEAIMLSGQKAQVLSVCRKPSWLFVIRGQWINNRGPPSHPCEADKWIAGHFTRPLQQSAHMSHQLSPSFQLLLSVPRVLLLSERDTCSFLIGRSPPPLTRSTWRQTLLSNLSFELVLRAATLLKERRLRDHASSSLAEWLSQKRRGRLDGWRRRMRLTRLGIN